MKKIGIIGGVGPQATIELLNSIIKFSISKYGIKNNDEFPNVAVEFVPIPDFITDTTKIHDAREMLIDATENLMSSKTTMNCIASNTVHILLDDLVENTGASFLSMIPKVAQECKDRAFARVGILGSPVTKKYGLYSKYLGELGIEAIYPSDDDQRTIDKIIRHVLAGTDNGSEKSEYIKIFTNMLTGGADGIILACTELPHAIDYEALGNRVVDSNKVLAEALVDYYYLENIN